MRSTKDMFYLMNTGLEMNVLKRGADAHLMHGDNTFVLGRDRVEGMSLVVGLGALGIGIAWLPDSSACEYKFFDDCMSILYEEG